MRREHDGDVPGGEEVAASAEDAEGTAGAAIEILGDVEVLCASLEAGLEQKEYARRCAERQEWLARWARAYEVEPLRWSLQRQPPGGLDPSEE